VIVRYRSPAAFAKPPPRPRVGWHGATAGKRPSALTRADTCGNLRRELGVYLLGAIAPADRSTLESHLESCAGCRGQLADLAGLPALLGRVPPDEVDSLVQAEYEGGGGRAPPDRPLGSLLSQAAKRRRHRVRSQLAAAAAAVLAVAAGALYGALGTASRQPATPAPPGAITVRGADSRTHAAAVVTYAVRPWGLQLYVQVKGIATGTHCELEVTDSEGQESVAGSWTIAADDETAWYEASSSVSVTGLSGFVVTAGARQLVRVGVPAPPRKPASPSRSPDNQLKIKAPD
jgi:Putative zinc-finger